MSQCLHCLLRNFFLKFWGGRTTLNGEKRGDGRPKLSGAPRPKAPARMWYTRHFIILLISYRCTFFRSVWIVLHQQNRWIHSEHGFIGSFDAPWSRQILDYWSWFRSPQRNAPLKYASVPISTLAHSGIVNFFPAKRYQALHVQKYPHANDTLIRNFHAAALLLVHVFPSPVNPVLQEQR